MAEGVASLGRLVAYVSGRPDHHGPGWAAETLAGLTRAFDALGRALVVLALAERVAVELHHAAPVRLPPGHEARALVAMRALLEVVAAVLDVRLAIGLDRVREFGEVVAAILTRTQTSCGWAIACTVG